MVNKTGIVSLDGRQILAADIRGGRSVTIRNDAQTLTFFDPATRQLLRARPNPLSWDQVRRLRGARPAGPPSRPSTEPVTVQRRASAADVIFVARQKIALGRAQAGRTVTVHVAEHTLTVETEGGPRTVTRPIRNLKPTGPGPARPATFPSPPVAHQLRPRRQASGGTRQPMGRCPAPLDA